MRRGPANRKEWPSKAYGARGASEGQYPKDARERQRKRVAHVEGNVTGESPAGLEAGELAVRHGSLAERDAAVIARHLPVGKAAQIRCRHKGNREV